MTAALEKWQFRDPAEVAERVEAGTCQGCALVVRQIVAGAAVESCAKGRRYGTKCRFYFEREPTATTP